MTPKQIELFFEAVAANGYVTDPQIRNGLAKLLTDVGNHAMYPRVNMEQFAEKLTQQPEGQPVRRIRAPTPEGQR